MLDLHAAVGDHVELGLVRDPHRLVAVQPELDPQRARARRHGLLRDAGKVVGAAEDVDDVGLARQLGQRRIGLEAEDLVVVGRDRPDLVVGRVGAQIAEHEVARAVGLARRADHRDRLRAAQDRLALERPRRGPRAARGLDLAAAHPSARSRSKRMSSGSSMPTLIRTSSGSTPAASSAASESWRWVVEPGWITSVRVSPTLARCEHSSTAPMKRSPASRPSASPNEKTAPGPFGRYFWASAWFGSLGSPP